MPLNTVYVNGRFLTQSMTGVQRYAREILDAIDSILDESANDHTTWKVLAPKGTPHRSTWKKLQLHCVGNFHGHIWEQFELPRYAAEGLLLTLCGAPSVIHRKRVSAIHDAAIYDCPDSYKWLYRIFYRIIYGLSVRGSLAILTVSQFSRNRLAEIFRIPKERIIVTYNGVDHITRDATSDRNASSLMATIEQPYILAVSSLNPSKNFAVIVKLSSFLADRGIHILVAGGANPRVFDDTKSMSSNIRWLGYVSDDDLKTLYRSASCFIFPSIYEGFGLPPIEAMALGCPVIASSAASIPEICGNAALYFDPTSVEDLREKIIKILYEAGLRNELTQAGSARSRTYTWRKSAIDILETIDKLSSP